MALPLAVLVLAVGVLAEVGGRVAVERISEDRLRDAGIAGDVDVTVGRSWWRPSVLPALAGADLDRVSVRLRAAGMYSVRVEQADYVLEGLDVAISLRRRTIGATSLRRGAVVMFVDPSSMAGDLGVRAEVEGGRLLVGPDREPVSVSVDDEDLVVTGDALAGGEERLPLVDPDVFPCTPRVRVAEDRLVLYCGGDRLPGVLGVPLGPDDEVETDDLPLAPVELEPPATMELDEPHATTREEDDGG